MCRFESCTREVYVDKWRLCSGHYNQQCRGRELRPLRGTPEWRSISVIDDMKTCTRCGYTLPMSDFHAKGECNGIRAHCSRCNTLRRMNLTSREYDEMLSAQGGMCAICGKDPEGNGRALAVDHDHECCPYGGSCGKCVRGLLCDDCNVMLGRARDNTSTLRWAADYLEHTAGGVR